MFLSWNFRSPTPPSGSTKVPFLANASASKAIKIVLQSEEGFSISGRGPTERRKLWLVKVIKNSFSLSILELIL